VPLLRAALAGESLEALGPVWRAELARLLPEAGGADLPAPSDDALRLFESVARCIRDLASGQPLVLILEDLQWADDLSLRLLALLARELADTPVLLVGTAREEELTDAPALRRFLGELAGQPQAVNLALPTLSKEETANLVRALSGGRRDQDEMERLAARIWAGSQGNPLVIVETMRALGKDSVPETLPMPERVQQLIAERLARLGALPQELVAVAATIGGEFEFELLRQASGFTELEAVESLEELVRHRVLQSVGERFDFTHERVREAAYTRLVPPRQRLLHAQVAAALEHLNAADPGRCAASLGRHYRECHAWDKAWPYMRQAGAQAAAHAAHREAAACYEQALDALEHLPESDATLGHAIDLRFDLRSSLFTLGEHSRIAEHLREAEGLATRLGDRRRLGWVLRYACNYHWMNGDLAQALEAGERGLAIAESLGDPGLRAALSFVTGQVHYARGAYASGVELFAATVAALGGERLHERFGFHSPLSILARTWLAFCLAETGAFDEGVAAGEEALRIAEDVEHPEAKVAARMGLGQALLRRGEAARALPLFEQAHAVCKSRHLIIWLRPIAMHIAAAYGMLGRLDEAIALLEPGGWRTHVYAAERGALLARTYLRAGRINDAVSLAAQAVEWARKSGERGREAWGLAVLAEAESRCDRAGAGAAERHRTEAMSLALELGMRPLAARLGAART
jgi:tetratricopeptide (TPR) repeat protein